MILLTIGIKSESDCKGLVFKCVDNDYFSNDRIVKQRTMRLMKKLSCSGCEQCGPLLDDVKEFMFDQSHAVMTDNCEHGNLYQLIVVKDSQDWETGYWDDWHYEFSPL